MNLTHQRSPCSSQKGIALLECLVAILIFSFGVLGIVGLQANMVKHEGEARYRAKAGNIVQQRMGQIWLDQANLSSYGETDTDVSGLGLPNGKRSTTRGGANCFNDLSCFIVTVTWQQPGTGATRSVTTIGRVTGGV